MDIEALRIFVDVMKHGSFAAVARQRDLDPSSVSRSISALETELGVRLLQRTTRKLAPTEAGAEYFTRVEGPLREMERADSRRSISWDSRPVRYASQHVRPSGSAYWLPCCRSFASCIRD
jgi:DNA-binding transcriptional LysR family regulator